LDSRWPRPSLPRGRSSRPNELDEVVIVESETESPPIQGGVAAAGEEEPFVGNSATIIRPTLAAERAEPTGELVEFRVRWVAGVVLALDEDVLTGDAMAGEPSEEASPVGVGVSDVDPLAGTSATDEPRLGRLGEFGREVVAEMNLCDQVPALAVSDRQPWPR
jgi:hypothetical protein